MVQRYLFCGGVLVQIGAVSRQALVMGRHIHNHVHTVALVRLFVVTSSKGGAAMSDEQTMPPVWRHAVLHEQYSSMFEEHASCKRSSLNIDLLVLL